MREREEKRNNRFKPTHGQEKFTHEQLFAAHSRLSVTHGRLFAAHLRFFDIHERLIDAHSRLFCVQARLIGAHLRLFRLHETVNSLVFTVKKEKSEGYLFAQSIVRLFVAVDARVLY